MGKRKAIVLLSGGIDSATTLAWAKKEGFATHALTFHYGQRHACEVAAASRIAHALQATSHEIVELPSGLFGPSALTAAIPVPKGRSMDEAKRDIPPTYVPARNTIFLSLALARAEVFSIEDIFIGVNAVDYSGYPDCRPAFVRAFEEMANLAIKAAVEGQMKSRFEHLCST